MCSTQLQTLTWARPHARSKDMTRHAGALQATAMKQQQNCRGTVWAWRHSACKNRMASPICVITCAQYGKCWRAYLEAICSEIRILKKLSEAFHVAFPAHVGQVRHQVCNDFEACILGQMEAVPNSSNCVAPVGISCYILKYALQPNL